MILERVPRPSEHVQDERVEVGLRGRRNRAGERGTITRAWAGSESIAVSRVGFESTSGT
ncbi:hypothetical protein [Sinorhizobium meliloti]|uniref:hypothetical protein n=1 Tax=Rhizobium meliloti TaxID=382 RepID=UPI0020903824|nr:hypothetical protein [Sinorhizobium meliloti]MCO5966102.1 hypothetical protein [Sinorhizobium meliloti]